MVRLSRWVPVLLVSGMIGCSTDHPTDVATTSLRGPSKVDVIRQAIRICVPQDAAEKLIATAEWFAAIGESCPNADFVVLYKEW